MKWSFFKSSPTETKTNTKTLVTPPRPASVALKPPTAATYHLKQTQLVNDNAPALTVDQGMTIAVPLNTIADQLPATLFPPTVAERLAGFNLEIPASDIIPQLPTGKVTLTVGEVFSLFPPDARPLNLINSVRQQIVTLPIDLIVGLIPSEAFQTRGDDVEEVDDAELEKLPALFDDSYLTPTPDAPARDAQPAALDSADEVDDETDIFSEKSDAKLGETQRIAFPGLPVEKPQPVAAPAAAAAAKLPYPAPTPAPAVAPVTAPLPPGVPSHVKVALRSLVNNMPAELFVCPPPALWDKADPQLPISLPVNEILPTLGAGRVMLALRTVAQAMPVALFAAPVPANSTATVVVPLSEVISQLPPAAFASATTDATAPEDDLDFVEDEELAAVFHERSTPPPLPEPVVETPVAPAEPVTASAPEPVAIPEPIAEPEVMDEDFAVFVEQTEPVAFTPAPEPTPEPVAEPTPAIAPAPEPVAEVQPAPVAQPVTAPAPAAFDERKFLINVNTCGLADLTNISGIGPAMAKRIIEHREVHGQFTSLDQLREIPGIGRKTFRALAGASPNALNRALGVEHNRELTLQEIIQLTGTQRGVEGCILTSAEGLFLTGHLPPHLDENRLSVFAPQLFKKVGRYARELSVGQVHRMTMFTDQQPVSIFQAGDIFLIVIHDTQHFSKALLRRLTRISEGIARLCRQRAVV